MCDVLISSSDLILRGPPLPRPPTFPPNRLAQYPVPQELWAWARLEQGAHCQAPPLLQEPLGPSNYSYKMALLLHLEEVALTFEMEKVSSCCKITSNN